MESSERRDYPTYKFAIAFENSNAEDYVTEKLFGAFAAGAVPSTHPIEGAYTQQITHARIPFLFANCV
jgi:hypothetical protein